MSLKIHEYIERDFLLPIINAQALSTLSFLRYYLSYELLKFHCSSTLVNILQLSIILNIQIVRNSN